MSLFKIRIAGVFTDLWSIPVLQFSHYFNLRNCLQTRRHMTISEKCLFSILTKGCTEQLAGAVFCARCNSQSGWELFTTSCLWCTDDCGPIDQGLFLPPYSEVKCLHIPWILLMRSPLGGGWNYAVIRLFLKFYSLFVIWVFNSDLHAVVF